MKVAEFLSYLRSLNINLWAEGDRLRYSAPKEALTPELLAQMTEHKAEMMDFLREANASVRTAASPILRAKREGDLPLSFSQQRLWFIDRMMPDNSAYNCPAVALLKGRLNIPALEQSLSEIVRRHEVFRTTFFSVNGHSAQAISEAETLNLRVVDLSALPDGLIEAETKRLARKESHKPFNLARDLLLRTALLRVSDQEHVALFTMHHIAADGWSVIVLFREIAALYGVFSKGSPSPLAELAIQYADFAYWQRQWLQTEVLEAQLAYWREHLGPNPPELKLPTDRPRRGDQTFTGAHHALALEADVSRRLKALSDQEGATPFMTMLAGIQVLLSYHSKQEDILLGIDVANRNRAEIEPLIGFFVNQLVLRTDLSGNPTFKQLLGRVRDVTLGAYAHQDLPFDKLVEALNPVRDLSRTPLFQVSVSFNNARGAKLELPGLTVFPIVSDVSAVHFDLIFILTNTSKGFRGWIHYNTDLFDKSTIARLAGQLEAIFSKVVAQPETKLDALRATIAGVEKEQRMKEKATLEQTSKQLLNARQRAKRKIVSVSREGLIRSEPLCKDKALPLLIQPAAAGVSLISWAKSNRDFIEAQLSKFGAILFRNFDLQAVTGFEQFIEITSGELLEYNERSSPRTRVSNKTYTSTEYPAQESIFLHNENSYQHTWPLKLFFFCVTAAQKGGETPLADCRKVFERIEPGIRNTFIEKSILYARNFGGGFGLPWQTVFNTTEPSSVEQYCRNAGISFQWEIGSLLKTRSVRQAVARHPRTSEMVWFNHAAFFHVSTLEPPVRDMLLATFEEEDLPTNTYYGDASQIDPAVLDALRHAYRQETITFSWQDGDILMLDNMLVAHGRMPYAGPRKVLVGMSEPFSDRGI